MPAFSRVTTTALISVMAPASAFFLYNKQSLLTVARCQEDEQIVIVKLGGSAITEKSVFETVKKDKIDVTCTQIATASRLGKRHVIVHGAGSFGHFQARTFGLRDGGDESTWQTGVCQTRSSVLSLSGLVIKSMLDASLPATAVTLFPTSSSHQGNIFSVGSLASIETLLSLGFMPVLHGDVLLDSSKKCSVFSGDKIMLWICKHFHGSLKPKLAVFLTDVPGVYDKPPSEPDAQLIKEILVDVDGSVSFPQTSIAEHDVTGGILGKLQCAVAMARCGVPVVIVEAGSSYAEVALAGSIPEIGTLIRIKNQKSH